VGGHGMEALVLVGQMLHMSMNECGEKSIRWNHSVVSATP
jgi:hypothetical protein